MGVNRISSLCTRRAIQKKFAAPGGDFFLLALDKPADL
jgi:hypothetical protein